MRAGALAGLVVALAATACGASNGASGHACYIRYSGNTTNSVSVSNCVALTSGGDGGRDVVLSLKAAATTSHPIQFNAKLDLGPSPATGQISSETVQGQWSVVGISAETGCEFSAGDQSVPTGNFTLTLSAVSASVAHGSLHAEQYVQAPPTPTVDCGPDDTETVNVTF
jgi:hypothetical protein